LRAGNAGSNTAADHKAVLAEALAQLPSSPGYRVGRRVLVRTDTAGGTHEFVQHLHQRRLSYSVGFFLIWCRGQLPDLELRHRRRARAEDRIRVAKDTGLANLPLYGFDQNRIWCAIVQLACELIV
jgi:Transposase DDE domain group 1